MAMNSFLSPSSHPAAQALNAQQSVATTVPSIAEALGLVEYTQQFATATPALFRDDVIDRIVSVLSGTLKPNVLLTGPAGVGKTRCVEELARRIATHDASLPPTLHGVRVFELPVNTLVQGTRFQGDLEKRLKQIMDFFTQDDDSAVVFIDEMHQILTHPAITQALKPALARGQIRVIGATTDQELRDFFSDPAFSRRFDRVTVPELTPQQTQRVVSDYFPTIAARHHTDEQSLVLPDDMVETVVALSQHYHAPGSHQPDAALTLLDRACSDAVLAHRKKRKKLLEAYPDMAVVSQQPTTITLTDQQLRKSAHMLVGGSMEHMHVPRENFVKALSVIRGQEQAMDQIVDAVMVAQNPVLNVDHQPFTMLFAGGSGLGKSETARILSQTLYGTDPIFLAMTEFSTPGSTDRLIGSPPGFVGYNSNAEMPFDPLLANPYRVVILDEFEKCHRDTQRLFLRILGDGQLTTNRGVTYDFSKALIIATTNAGHSTGASHGIGFSMGNKSASQVSMDSLKDFFEPELLGRFRLLTTFQPLSLATFTEIVCDFYESERIRIHKNHNVSLPCVDDSEDVRVQLSERARQAYIPQLGARPAQACVSQFIQSLLT